MKKQNFCAHQKSGYIYSPLVSIYSVHYSKLLGKCHWEEVNKIKKDILINSNTSTARL